MLVFHGDQSNLHDVEMNASPDTDSGVIDTSGDAPMVEGEGQRNIRQQERGQQEG
jgi:hypothetical protein